MRQLLLRNPYRMSATLQANWKFLIPWTFICVVLFDIIFNRFPRRLHTKDVSLKDRTVFYERITSSVAKPGNLTSVNRVSPETEDSKYGEVMTLNYTADEEIAANLDAYRADFNPVNETDMKNVTEAQDYTQYAYEEMETRPVFLTVAMLGGRVGNMLFQIASLLGIAYLQRMTPVMRTDQSLNTKLNTSSALVLVPSVTEFAKEYEFEFEMFTESSCCSFNELATETFENDVVLYGYYQSWKYFDHIDKDMREIFQFNRQLLDQARFFLEMQTPPAWNMKNFLRIGIHVRRGDLGDNKKQQFGYTIAPKEYYLKAINYFRAQFKGTNILFIVCSDDMDWSKENIKGEQVIYSTLTNEYVDLALLSLCDHAIISTGSFSWWGGWYVKGQVVYYSKWPAVGSKLARQVKAEDYFMEHWTPMTEDGDKSRSASNTTTNAKVNTI